MPFNFSFPEYLSPIRGERIESARLAELAQLISTAPKKNLKEVNLYVNYGVAPIEEYLLVY